jgi:hypothetical protein
MPEILRGGATPEPVPVVNLVDDQPRLQHQGIRNHGVVVRIGVLLDLQILLDLSSGIGEKGPGSADSTPKLVQFQ